MDLLAELIPKMHYSEASPGMYLLAELIPLKCMNLSSPGMDLLAELIPLMHESVIVKHLLEYRTDPLKMHESVIYLLECIYQLAEL